MTKALVLFSGGLDSLLAIKLLEKQGIDCTALTFTTPFFGKKKAEEQAKKFGIKLMIKDISAGHFEVVQSPQYGQSKDMNPGIDYHGYMFQHAGEIAAKEGFDIIASGEVLGQRPMSQNKRSLEIVNKMANTEILRPLSAKLLDPTSYEINGLVDREKLLDIVGRTRERQLQMTKDFNLKGFTIPGGGCLSTEKHLSSKLRNLIVNMKGRVSTMDTEIIKYGKIRFFATNYGRAYAIMGRDEQDNDALTSLFEFLDEFYYRIEIADFPGPMILVKYDGPDIRETLLGDIARCLKEHHEKLEKETHLKLKFRNRVQSGEIDINF